MKINAIKRGYIEFDNGIMLSDFHEQDCCEQVYVDWDYLYQYNALGYQANKSVFDVEFNEKNIKDFSDIVKVKDMGFCLKGHINDYPVSVFVPCYNEQNGYYSDELRLDVIDDDETYKLNLSDCTMYNQY